MYLLDIRLNWLRWPISLAVRKKLNISMRTLLKRNMLYFVQGRNVNFLSIHWYFRYETTFNFAAIAAIFTFKFWFCTPDYDVFPLKICVWQKLARLTFNIDYVTPQRLFDTLDGMFSPNPWIYFTFPSGSENIWKGGGGHHCKEAFQQFILPIGFKADQFNSVGIFEVNCPSDILISVYNWPWHFQHFLSVLPL